MDLDSSDQASLYELHGNGWGDMAYSMVGFHRGERVSTDAVYASWSVGDLAHDGVILILDSA